MLKIQTLLFYCFLIVLVLVVVITALLLMRRNRHSIKKKDRLDNARFAAIQPAMVLGFLIVLIMCVLFSTSYYFDRFIADPVTETAHATLPLFNFTFVATSIAFFLTQIGVFYFAFRYRAKPGQTAAHVKQNSKIEIVWTLLPAFVFLFLFLWGQVLWAKIIKAPASDALEIEVVGQQFSWLARYPGKDNKLGREDFRFIDNINDIGIDVTDPNSQDDFIPIQMHVPKGRQIKLSLRSKDVIHSFYVPYFGVKMDAVPGMITTLNFTPMMTTKEMQKKLHDEDFDYEVACAELCGRMHFAMKLILVVDEPEDFEKWNAKQPHWIATHKNDTIIP